MLRVTDMPQTHETVRVLIVDDQASFRRAACSVVELTPGFLVIGEAETGEASIDAARAMQPDLVLMDVHLPGIDGLEASRRMLATMGKAVALPATRNSHPTPHSRWILGGRDGSITGSRESITA